MLHIIRRLERRFPRHGHRSAPALLLKSLLALLAGAVLYGARK